MREIIAAEEIRMMARDRTTYHADRDRLLQECRVLLEAIARQPYALKRLRAARAGLEMVRGYKSRKARSPAP